jgi:hypothetical protein
MAKKSGVATMKLTSIAALAATAIFASALVNAQGPSPRVSLDPNRHPTLAAAQDLVHQAFQKIEEGRRKKEFDHGEHLATAMNLLIQANNEIAAGVAN